MTAARAIPLALWALAAVLLGATLWPFVVSVPLGEGEAGAARRPSQPFPAPSWQAKWSRPGGLCLDQRVPLHDGP